MERFVLTSPSAHAVTDLRVIGIFQFKSTNSSSITVKVLTDSLCLTAGV